MRPPRRFVGVLALLLTAVLLTGCSYVNRVAARINPDGTLDFATCDARDADAFDIAWVYRDGSGSTGTHTTIPVVGKVEEGDVFLFDTSAPRDGWDSVSVQPGQ